MNIIRAHARAARKQNRTPRRTIHSTSARMHVCFVLCTGCLFARRQAAPMAEEELVPKHGDAHRHVRSRHARAHALVRVATLARTGACRRSCVLSAFQAFRTRGARRSLQTKWSACSRSCRAQHSQADKHAQRNTHTHLETSTSRHELMHAFRCVHKRAHSTSHSHVCSETHVQLRLCRAGKRSTWLC